MTKEEVYKALEEILPCKAPRLYINTINSEAVVRLKSGLSKRDISMMTCRPLTDKTNEEKKALYQDLIKSKALYLLGIYLIDTDELIGNISVFDYNERNSSVEIGFYLIKDIRGKGYGKEACQLVSRVLLKELGLHKIMAQTGSFNKGSRGMFEAIGYQLDGKLREHHELDGVFYDDCLYSLLQKDLKEC